MLRDAVMVPINRIHRIISKQKSLICLTSKPNSKISTLKVLKILDGILDECDDAFGSIEEPVAKNDETKYQSKHERTVARVIKKLGYTPYHNVIKRDCIGKSKPLPFDFGILVNGRELLIEFDGEQHETPIDFFGGIDKFKEIALYDAVKNEYCKEKDIPLLRLNKHSSILKEITTFISQYESQDSSQAITERRKHE